MLTIILLFFTLIYDTQVLNIFITYEAITIALIAYIGIFWTSYFSENWFVFWAVLIFSVREAVLGIVILICITRNTGSSSMLVF